ATAPAPAVARLGLPPAAPAAPALTVATTVTIALGLLAAILLPAAALPLDRLRLTLAVARRRGRGCVGLLGLDGLRARIAGAVGGRVGGWRVALVGRLGRAAALRLLVARLDPGLAQDGVDDGGLGRARRRLGAHRLGDGGQLFALLAFQDGTFECLGFDAHH